MCVRAHVRWGLNLNGQNSCCLDQSFHMLVPDVLEAFSFNVVICMVDKIILVYCVIY